MALLTPAPIKVSVQLCATTTNVCSAKGQTQGPGHAGTTFCQPGHIPHTIFFSSVFLPCPLSSHLSPHTAHCPFHPSVTTAVGPAIPRSTENLLPLCLQEKKKMLLSRDFQQLLLVESHHLPPASSGERRAGVGGTWSLQSHPCNLATKGRTAPELLSQHCLSGGLSLECPLPPPTKRPHDGFSLI